MRLGWSLVRELHHQCRCMSAIWIMATIWCRVAVAPARPVQDFASCCLLAIGCATRHSTYLSIPLYPSLSLSLSGLTRATVAPAAQHKQASREAAPEQEQARQGHSIEPLAGTHNVRRAIYRFRIKVGACLHAVEPSMNS